MDYCLPLADKLQQKGASLRWISGHREEAQATSPVDKQDNKRNKGMDLLAKHGTRIPLEEVAPGQPHSIDLAGAEAPTPAKQWISTFRSCSKWTGECSTGSANSTRSQIVELQLGGGANSLGDRMPRRRHGWRRSTHKTQRIT